MILNYNPIQKWYVYEIYNSLGTIEYIGETNNPHIRFYHHTKRERGTFYGRTDIVMYVAAEFDNKKDAFDYQCQLQKESGLQPDNEKNIGINNGMFGKTHSYEAKLKMRKPKPADFGKKISEARKLYWAQKKGSV